MVTMLDKVNDFYAATLKGADGIDQIAALLADDVTFRGPLQAGDGKDEVVAIYAAFNPAVHGFRAIAQFEDADTACSIHEFDAFMPDGSDLTLLLAELFEFEDGLIAKHQIVFDPTKVVAAMTGAEQGP